MHCPKLWVHYYLYSMDFHLTQPRNNLYLVSAIYCTQFKGNSLYCSSLCGPKLPAIHCLLIHNIIHLWTERHFTTLKVTKNNSLNCVQQHEWTAAPSQATGIQCWIIPSHYSLQDSVYCEQGTMYNSQWTVYIIQWTLYNSQYTVYYIKDLLKVNFFAEPNCLTDQFTQRRGLKCHENMKHFRKFVKLCQHHKNFLFFLFCIQK